MKNTIPELAVVARTSSMTFSDSEYSSDEDDPALGECANAQQSNDSLIINQTNVLILDLDETIVRVFTNKPSCPNYGEAKRITYTDSTGLQVLYVIKRPHLDEFLKRVSQRYRVFIYTQSLSQYAQAIIEGFGLSEYICGIYSRDHCKIVSDNNYEKDIFTFGFEVEKLVFIDDWERHTQKAPQNSINIRFFNGRNTDDELVGLQKFLLNLANDSDVRSVVDKFREFQRRNIRTSFPLGRGTDKTSLFARFKEDVSQVVASKVC